MIKSKLEAVLGAVLLCGPFPAANAESFYEMASRSVVHLKIPKHVHEKVNGEWWQVWLRDPMSENAVPKMITGSGNRTIANWIIKAPNISIKRALEKVGNHR